MYKWNKLKGKHSELKKDLTTTTLTFIKLGKKYGTSKQAIQAFCKRREIVRPEKIKRHITEKCSTCKKLLKISALQFSDFLASSTIMQKVGLPPYKKWMFRFHLNILRRRCLVSPNFGKMNSIKAERAYRIYLRRPIPIRTCGRLTGLKNFQSVIRRHRQLGRNVPPSLYKYDGQERSKNMIRRYKQMRKEVKPE
jgi:hypothetical protein